MPASPTPESTPQPTTPIRIVLADDQAMIRQGLGYILNAQPDMTVVGEAADGREAVAAVRAARPDVVLMDIRMPHRSGIEATAEIMRDDPNVKVLLLTTFDVQEYVFDGIRAGAVGYLLKDSDAAELVEAIRLAAQGAAIYRTASAGRALAQAVASAGSGAAADSPYPNTGERTRPAQKPTENANPKAASPQLQPFLPDNAPNEASAQTDSIAYENASAPFEPLTARETEVLQLMAYGKRNAVIAAELCVTEGTVKTHVHAILQKLGAEDRTQAVVAAIRGRLVR